MSQTQKHFFKNHLFAQVGSSVSLPCQASGLPTPTISWLMESGLLQEEVTPGPEGSLDWPAVTKEEGGRYRCQASNSAGTDTKTAELVVAAHTARLQEEEVIVERDAGQPVTLECKVVVDPALLPSLTRVWSREGEELPGRGEETLYINYLQAQHEGVYTCRATTSLDTVTASTSVRVRTQAPAISRLPEQLGEVAGGSLEVECSATGVPPPRVTFRRGEQEWAGKEVMSSLLLYAPLYPTALSGGQH